MLNSTSERLYYGVPLIAIPQNADQPIIAGQIAKIGAGLQLQTQNLTPIQLREAAEDGLNNKPSYNKSIDRIK
jgi:UDP:flavonoid glycosyltransferase YjiC (YdhE family)